MKYKNKPSEVDAEKIDDLLTLAASNFSALPGWVGTQFEAGNILFGSTHLVVTTANGSRAGNRNDYLVFRNGSLQVLEKKDLDADYEAR